MELEKILGRPRFEHALTEQEIQDMKSVTDGERKLALAKDWSVIRQRLDWQERHIIQMNNLVADMEASHQFQKNLFRMITSIVLAGGGLYGLARLLGVAP